MLLLLILLELRGRKKGHTIANFIKHTSCPECGSKDNFALYRDDDDYESGYCFGCSYTIPSKEYLAESKGKGGKVVRNFRKEQALTDITSDEKDRISTKPKVTQEQTDELKSRTHTSRNGYRGIRDEIVKSFGVRAEIDENDEVLTSYYPCTIKGELSGWKPRKHPKSFGGSIGVTGKECDMFGQFRYKNGGRDCLIVGGEEDAMAAYQMLKDYYRTKNYDFDPVVVSGTVGETSGTKQLANNYEFFSQFNKIVLGFDNDTAGETAAEKAVAVLPKGKVHIAKWNLKDPNEMLLKSKEKQFISDYYNAKAYVPVGVVASNQISDAMREELKIPKIPLPPFMHKLQDMMAGGVPLGRAVNLGSSSGVGKSTIVDEIIYYMLFNSPHLCGIVTLESTKGQYGIKLLSRHVSKKLELLTQDDALELIDSDEIKEKEYELFNKPDGTPRFYLIDDRDGTATDVQQSIENLVVSCGCKVIILDPIHDIIAALPLEEQENFMSWQKGMMKSHRVTFFNVAHTRKTSGGQKAGSTGADLHEEDIMGNSAIYKSAACNLMFSRNKEAEDELERNTTVMKATKIRWTGKTGIAGKYYYHNESHTLYDLDDWLSANGPRDF